MSIREALRETKNRLRDVADEVRSMVDAVRPEEPLISKTRRIFGNPIRRRLEWRINKRRTKRED